MRYIFLIFIFFIKSTLVAQESSAFALRQTLNLSVDTFEHQKLGAFEISVKRREYFDWRNDQYIISSKYGEKTDTLWPRKTYSLRDVKVSYVKNVWLFEQNKLVMIMLSTSRDVVYFLYKWNGDFWDLADARYMGVVFRGYNNPDMSVQAINYNKLIATQGNKKELIEYDLTTKTEKRTEIKE